MVLPGMDYQRAVCLSHGVSVAFLVHFLQRQEEAAERAAKELAAIKAKEEEERRRRQEEREAREKAEREWKAANEVSQSRLLLSQVHDMLWTSLINDGNYSCKFLV